MNSANRSTLIMIVSVLLIASGILLFGKPLASANAIALLQANGMTCGSCSQKITQALTKHPGVAEVTVDITAGLIEVQFDSRQTNPATLAANVNTLGYPTAVAYVQPIKGAAKAPADASGCGTGGCGNCNKKQQNLRR